MSLKSDLGKLRERSRAERLLLVRAAVVLGVMRLAVGLLPFRAIVRALRLEARGRAVEGGAVPDARAEQVGWAIRSAAAHLPWNSTCLMQALACAALLPRRGAHATLHLGVAKDALRTEGIAAHAWLRCGDLVLTGEPEHERFTVVASYSLPGRV